MARRVGRERSILGTELEEPKVVARGGEGTGECVEDVTHGLPWRLKETLHAWRLANFTPLVEGCIRPIQNSALRSTAVVLDGNQQAVCRPVPIVVLIALICSLVGNAASHRCIRRVEPQSFKIRDSVWWWRGLLPRGLTKRCANCGVGTVEKYNTGGNSKTVLVKGYSK